MNTSFPTLNRLSRLCKILALSAMLLMISAGFVRSQEATTDEPAPGMYITEYRVIGAKKLDRRSVEKAVYPFLGPERTPEDVDAARASLEKAYRDAGYSTVSVLIPQQKVKKGVVLLQVSEAAVGRLRVNGSRYYDIERLKRRAPSMAEGVVPNFNDVNRDIVALNKSAGLRVTPALRAGVIPGTYDIDLNVKDELPLHGSLGINNDRAAFTTPWRVNGSLRYENLWQAGHRIGASFQIAPERRDDGEVYSGYYIAPLSDRWSLILEATKQNSIVASLEGATTIGIGNTQALRLSATLPEKRGFNHSLAFGVERKSYDPMLIIAGIPFDDPVTYYPLSIDYSSTWLAKNHSTDLNARMLFSLAGTADDSSAFNSKRFSASDGYIYFQGDLSHTHDLPGGAEMFGKIQAQWSPDALISNEMFSAGGASTVRGYLQPAVLGDSGIVSTFELRSPSLYKATNEDKIEWRFHVFADAGYVTKNLTLPEEESNFTLASVGAGTRFRILDHLSGSVDAGIPLIQQGVTDVGELLISVRFMAEF